MQIIIPMTGNGSRFREAGYSELKPFIKIQGKPLIEWVVNVCRWWMKLHSYVDTSILKEIIISKILQICLKPKSLQSKIGKKRPCLWYFKAREFIDDNHCNCFIVIITCFGIMLFKKDVIEQNCDGSVPCYSGFHHLIPKANFYASCKVDSYDYLIEIKKSFLGKKKN